MACSWAKYERSNNTGNERWKKKRRGKKGPAIYTQDDGNFQVFLLHRLQSYKEQQKSMTGFIVYVNTVKFPKSISA